MRKTKAKLENVLMDARYEVGKYIEKRPFNEKGEKDNNFNYVHQENVIYLMNQTAEKVAEMYEATMRRALTRFALDFKRDYNTEVVESPEDMLEIWIKENL